MSGRNWDRVRQRDMVRRHGTDSIREADIPSALRPKRKMLEGQEAIFAAARWLVQNRQRLRDESRHWLPEMQREFPGMTAKQCIEALQHANAAEQKGR